MQYILYLASYSKVKLNKALGQRGVEMVEYAIVLACIAVVAAAYYHMDAKTTNQFKGTTLRSGLEVLFDKVNNRIPK